MSDKRVYSNNPRVLAVQTLAKIKNGAYSNLQSGDQATPAR